MPDFKIEGGVPLRGEITASGNKNAALPMLAAALLTQEEVVLENLPDIADVRNMCELLTFLGVIWKREGEILRIQAKEVSSEPLTRDLCNRVRTSILFVAPLLHRTRQARLHPPGGGRRGYPDFRGPQSAQGAGYFL
jgi:UDP-N-acetylglucosamine 1-carboxyvinyltransferase